MSREVVVLSAVRSAIGTFGGTLADIEPSELAGTVMKEAVARSGVDPQAINYITVGDCIPTDSRFAYVARVASIQAGLPDIPFQRWKNSSHSFPDYNLLWSRSKGLYETVP